MVFNTERKLQDMNKIIMRLTYAKKSNTFVTTEQCLKLMSNTSFIQTKE